MIDLSEEEILAIFAKRIKLFGIESPQVKEFYLAFCKEPNLNSMMENLINEQQSNSSPSTEDNKT